MYDKKKQLPAKKAYKRRQALLQSIEEENFEKAREIFSNHKTPSRYNQLLTAVDEDNLAKVQKLCSRNSTKEKNAAVGQAAYYGKRRILEYLFTLNFKHDSASFRALLRQGILDLALEMERRQPDVLEDPNEAFELFARKTYNRQSPIFLNPGYIKNVQKFISLLLEHGLDVNSKNVVDNIILFMITRANKEILYTLHEMGFNVIQGGGEALRMAIHNNTQDRCKIVGWFIELGLNPHLNDDIILRKAFLSEEVNFLLNLVDYSDNSCIPALKSALMHVSTIRTIERLLTYQVRPEPSNETTVPLETLLKEDPKFLQEFTRKSALNSKYPRDSIIQMLLRKNLVDVSSIMLAVAQTASFWTLKNIVDAGYISWEDGLLEVLTQIDTTKSSFFEWNVKSFARLIVNVLAEHSIDITVNNHQIIKTAIKRDLEPVIRELLKAYPK